LLGEDDVGGKQKYRKTRMYIGESFTPIRVPRV
jgi:hypothetical protein